MTPSEFTRQVLDDSSRIVPGASITFMTGSRKGPVFLDPEMRTPARSPFITKADGMCHVFLSAGETYEITIETPKGRRWQFTHVAKGKEIVREPSVTVSEDTQHGAPPEVELQPAAPEIIEVEKIVHVENPETQERLAEALNEKAELKAALEEALGKLEARKTRVDEFPEELLDLVRENEPHADALSRLRGDYVQLTNRLVDTRLPALSNLERAYQNRLQKALYSERKGAVEITD